MEGREVLAVSSPIEEEPRIGTVILGIGSNDGDRVRQIERALGQLIMHLNLERISSIYESEPMGLRDQPWFLNLVCMGTTRLKPWDLLEFLHTVEDKLGRKRGGERFGPRTIDIDILAYDERVMEEADLEIPHPRMGERAFVLQPLAEIAPEWQHPVTGQTADEMLAQADAEVVRPYMVPPPPAAPVL